MVPPSDPAATPRRTETRDAPFRTDHLKTDLARRSVRGGAVTMVAQAVKVVAQFATIVILARLLSPGDFGLFAIVFAFLSIFEIFKDLGLSSATVQRPDITDRQVSTLFWMNGGLGVAVALVLTAFAPLLVWIYDEPILGSLAPVVAIALIFTGFAAQHLALLRRQMRFSALATVQTGSELIAMMAAIAAAVAGMGVWSLVVQRLVWGVVILAGSWAVCGWRPGRPGRLAEVRGLIAFGGNVTGAMVLGRCATGLNNLLIGWFWGAGPLGMFERAQKLVLMPIQNVNMPLAAVALPALSRLADHPVRYRRAYTSVTERLAMAIAPVAGLFIAASPAIVTLVLGPQWSEAAPILSWMGVSAVYMPVTYTLSWLYMSQNRTSEMLRASVVGAVLMVGTVAAALPLGPAGIAAAVVLTGIFLRVPILLWLVSRAGPLTLSDFGRILVLPATGVAGAALAVLALNRLTPAAALPAAANVALSALIAGLAALLVYVATPRGRRAIAETLTVPRMMFSQDAHT